MIFGIVGGVGTGKTVSAVKTMIDSPKYCFCNFDVKSKNVTRIKKDHIMTEEQTGETPRGKPIMQKSINWKFWNRQLKKKGEYHILLDEVHNLFHSRQSMAKWNVLGTMWFSQIRKVLGNSETTHIYLISQKISRIDVAFRDLIHGIILCEKFVDSRAMIKTKVLENGKLVVKKLPIVWILRYYFMGNDCISMAEAYERYGDRTYTYRTGFIANPYFQHYDSYEIMGETAYL